MNIISVRNGPPSQCIWSSVYRFLFL